MKIEDQRAGKPSSGNSLSKGCVCLVLAIAAGFAQAMDFIPLPVPMEIRVDGLSVRHVLGHPQVAIGETIGLAGDSWDSPRQPLGQTPFKGDCFQVAVDLTYS